MARPSVDQVRHTTDYRRHLASDSMARQLWQLALSDVHTGESLRVFEWGAGDLMWLIITMPKRRHWSPRVSAAPIWCCASSLII
ncbi:MAG: hypothetical protein RMM98_07425 [Acidobacteriota bacterium]|nr:hypothetical protein [Acidobacteriota bacterium]